MTATHWSRHLVRLQHALAQQRIGFITDIDGTISAIAPTPEQACIDPGCRDQLCELADHITLVATISGRAAAAARRMLQLDNLTYVGNHGFERLTPHGLHIAPEAQPYIQPLAQLLEQLKPHLNIPGIIIENKTTTASIHYRQAPNPQVARETILHHLQPRARAAKLRITHGRRVIEIRPPLDCDKGTALQSLLRDHQLSAACYAGDDWTDRDAFRALHDWAASTADAQALALAVISDETPQPLIDEADLTILGIPDMRNLLAWINQTLPKPPPMR